MSERTQRVLICDNESAQYEKVKKYLSSQGFVCVPRVEAYDEVSERLRAAREERQWYHLVMIDVDLGRDEMNGIQMYHRLVTEFPDETYVIYSRRDVDRFRREISRLRFREVALILLDDIHRLRLHLTPLLDTADRKKVFLVCGRNGSKNQQLRTLLSRGLGLEVIDWEVARRAAGKDYIWEIVLKGIEMSHATVVLFTDDETVRLRPQLVKKSDPDSERVEQRQARPNVYIEAGYARGLRQKRTVFVDWPDVPKQFRPASDFQGVHGIRFDGGPASREVLSVRLQDARCLVTEKRNWSTMRLAGRRTRT